MSSSIAVRLEGELAADTAAALVVRIAELGGEAAVADPISQSDRSSGSPCRDRSDWEIGPTGAVVAVSCENDDSETCIEFVVDRHDTPEFAAEKILDILAERGAIRLDTQGYSPDEERKIHDRLADLGYVD